VFRVGNWGKGASSGWAGGSKELWTLHCIMVCISGMVLGAILYPFAFCFSRIVSFSKESRGIVSLKSGIKLFDLVISFNPLKSSIHHLSFLNIAF
jgi:hypothetical protein